MRGITQGRYAAVTSTLALAIALGGTSYAAITLPRNSVGTTQIKPRAVKSSDLGASSVSSGKVRDRSLRALDFALGQLPSGPTGPAGPAGAAGATGATGPTGVVGTLTVIREDVAVPDTGASTGVQATCPAGQRIVSGGYTLAESAATDVNTTVSRPFKTGNPNNGLPNTGDTFDSWRAVFVNAAGAPTAAATGRVFAICTPV
jgi:hypothetical protein